MSLTDTKIDLASVLETYLSAWNVPDPAERRRLLERSVSDNVVFVDPMKNVMGRDALAAHIADMRATFPDVMYGPGGTVDHHNSVLRQPWVARRGDEVVLRGIDIDDVAPDGRLSRIIGFFDQS